MSSKYLMLIIIVFLSVITTTSHAEKFIVSSQNEFDTAQNNASANDSIVWETGTFSDIYMIINKNNLYIGASTLGGTVFDGASRARVNSDNIVFEGFQYVGGDIGTNDIINNYGSYNHFNQLNLRAYTCYKYLRIREEAQYVSVTYCNFENRLNLDDQNILSILVDETNPGYHKVQYCSFKNFDGTGNDLGIEPIRIGLSTQADHISRSVVEYCYFTQCDGDGELISSKATQTVYRFNTFENNSKAELVLRHGSEAIVYGNFFLNGKGGVRVREGQNHYIYNNYFFELDDRAIYLQNNSSDPLDNINIAFNTVVDCSEIRLGGSGSFKPTDVSFSNNIFTDPDDDLFEDPTNTETWIGNISNGSLGITLPSSGMTVADPLLERNSKGFWGLSSDSPAIDAAMSGFAPLPQFEGIDSIDSAIAFDLMKQARPSALEERDLGCSEFPHDVVIQPIATEENTGPSYNTDVISDVKEFNTTTKNWIKVFPNPAANQIELSIHTEQLVDMQIDIFDVNGKKVRTLFNQRVTSGERNISRKLEGLSSGIYSIRASQKDIREGVEKIQSIKLIKL